MSQCLGATVTWPVCGRVEREGRLPLVPYEIEDNAIHGCCAEGLIRSVSVLRIKKSGVLFVLSILPCYVHSVLVHDYVQSLEHKNLRRMIVRCPYSTT